MVHCHIVVAALHFFEMKGINDLLKRNTLPSSMFNMPTAKLQRVFSNTLGKLIDQYGIIVCKFSDLYPQPDIPRPVMISLIDTLNNNPHVFHIFMKHGTLVACLQSIFQEHDPYQLGSLLCPIILNPHMKYCRHHQIMYLTVQVLS